ncbi:MAG: hypothetical protein ACSLFR_04175 [Solirubrobacteraceae bacterium]
MTRHAHILSVFAITVISLAALGACGPGAPIGEPSGTPTVSVTSTPSATATAESEPEPAVASSIEISGTQVVVGAADATTIAAIPFTADGVGAANQITAALGVEPVLSTRPENSCQPQTTVYTWGGLDLHVPPYTIAAPGAAFTVQANGPATAEGVPIRSFGIAVGSRLAEVNAVPGVYVFEDGFGGLTAQLERTSGSGPEDPNAAGALAFLSAGIVTDLISPVYYYGDC